MKYDFDTVVDRGGNRSAKYDERTKKFGTDQVIPLWIADMDFKTAQPIVDALTARAQEGIWGYTSRPDSYFEAIRGWQKRRNGWDIDPSLMSFSLGVVQSISAMVKLFTPEGGSVLIQTPVYSEFYDMTEAWNRKVLENPFVEKDGRWEMDWADFEAKLAEADLFLLCSPHNPLGIVWTPEELRRMVELCIKHRVVLFSDEIHSDLIFHGKRHTPTASVSDEAARYVVTGISGTKTFNLAGLQASTVVFPNAHMKQVFDQFWMNMDIHRNNAFSLHGGRLQPRRGVAGAAAALPVRQLRLCGGLLPGAHSTDQDLRPRRHLPHVAGLPGAGPGQRRPAPLHDRAGGPGPQRRLLLRPQPERLHASQRRLPPQRAGAGDEAARSGGQGPLSPHRTGKRR